MKKTLLMAAAALAASVISSQAQVYSQNIVGYVNIPLTGGTVSLISPTLDADGTGTNNTVSTVFPSPSQGDAVYVFNGTGYDTVLYKAQNVHGVGLVTNWFLGSAQDPTYPINPGVGLFYLPAVNETNTQTGIVLSGTVTNQYFPSAGNITLLGSQIPLAGGLDSVLGYTPTIGDSAYLFNSGGSYDTYLYKVQNVHGVGLVTNWFFGSVQGEPQIAVGQGFWFQPAANTNWVETLNVN